MKTYLFDRAKNVPDEKNKSIERPKKAEKNTDEIKLILSAQKGEKAAFQTLIELYYPYVTNFLRKLSGNEYTAEDLTQETFLKIIRGIEKYDVRGKAAFSTYIITCAKNTYIDYLRKNKNIAVNIDELDLYVMRGIEREVFAKINLEQVLEALNLLPEEQSEAIKMKYFEQLTLAEIAVKMNCEPKTVKSRIHSGISKIKKLLCAGGNIDG